MQQNSDEEIQISNKFNDFEFGRKNEVVPFGERKTVASIVAKSPSSNAALICEVMKKCCVMFVDIEPSPLKGHILGLDDCNKIILVRAEIHYENLDNGKRNINIESFLIHYFTGADLTPKSLLNFKVFSCKGDVPFQVIPKKIGGFDITFIAFPLNADVRNIFSTFAYILHTFYFLG